MKRIGLRICTAALAGIVLLFMACTPSGIILIREQTFGSAFDVSCQAWSGQETCNMALEEGDSILVEISCECGDISLTICGKSGNEPYMGRTLETGSFVVTVSERDDYVILLSGKQATGGIMLTRITN